MQTNNLERKTLAHFLYLALSVALSDICRGEKPTGRMSVALAVASLLLPLLILLLMLLVLCNIENCF